MSIRSLASASLGAAIVLSVAACGEREEPQSEIPHVTQPTETVSEPTPDPSAGSGAGAESSGDVSVSGTIAEGLGVPWGIAFLPDESAIVTERDSKRVLRVTPEGDVTQLGTIEEAVPQVEAGLLGVAVPPDFRDGDPVYFYVTTSDDNRVLRASLSLSEGTLGEPEVVLDGIPQGVTHDGGRLAFGPDGFLYATTGETGTPDLAQDLDSLGGKILRIDAETGEPAPGNPDPDSPVWSSGHRNVQGLAWDDEGRLWASEFGSGFRDELNLIEAGGNYGWPAVEGMGGEPEFTDPHVVWDTDDASPSGLAWAEGHLWMAGLRGERLWRIRVAPDGSAQDPEAFFTGKYGRLRTVVRAPDGSLWVATSNHDGRGNPREGDDRILRLTVG